MPQLKTMPWRARCELMVARGEAVDFHDAASKLRKRRIKTMPRQPVDMSKVRLPYKD